MLFSSYCCWRQKEREGGGGLNDTVRAESRWISVPDGRSSFYLFESHQRNEARKMCTQQSQTAQTDRVTADVYSYLAGNLERGQCVYASMWRCVKAACRNANKAPLQLLGTFT